MNTPLSYRIAPKIMGEAMSFDQRFDQRSGREQICFTLLTIILAVISNLSYRAGYWDRFIVIVFAAYILYRVLCFLRQRRKISEEWGEISLLLREEGLEIAHSGARTLYFWSSIRKIHVIRKIPELDFAPLWPYIQKVCAMLKLKEKAKENSWIAVIMNSAQGTVIPVPLAAFASEEEEQAFLEAIRMKIASAQTPVE
jgi:Ca2+/Na+ antiporter